MVKGDETGIEARSSHQRKLEFPVSIDEPPCLPAGRDTGIDNDKH